MSGVHDDLATLREELNACESAREQPWVAHTALARVEAEIARLQQERDAARSTYIPPPGLDRPRVDKRHLETGVRRNGDSSSPAGAPTIGRNNTATSGGAS